MQDVLNPEHEAQTVIHISYQGWTYNIPLTYENAKVLNMMLKPWLKNAKKRRSKPLRKRRKRGKVGHVKDQSGPATEGAQ